MPKNSPTPDPHVGLANLTDFASAWNTHDAAIIRTLYTGDARYFTQEEMQKLANEEPIDVLVNTEGFLEFVRKYDGFKLRILGEPIEIYQKLVAFAYRWEDANKQGYNRVALLRYEGGQIFMHVDIVSAQQIPEQVSETSYPSLTTLDDLMKAWNEGDEAAASKLYSEQPLVLSDEDLAQAPWRDFTHPPQLANVLSQFTGWNPVVLSAPLRIDNMVVFAWRWDRTNLEFPAGYGVRLFRYDDTLITTDIRFAIRPWEKNGKHFMNP